MFGASYHIAAAGEQAGNGNVFADLFPMQAGAADAFALSGRRLEQPRKLGEQNTERSAVA